MSFSIHIQVPEFPTESWLRHQVEKLRVFRYAMGGGEWAYVEIIEVGGGIDRALTPNAMLGAVDCIFNGVRFRIFQQVVFEVGNTAYVGPNFYSDGRGVDSDAAIDERYGETWVKASWGEALLELSKSLASHINGISDASKREVCEALANLAQCAPEPITVECI